MADIALEQPRQPGAALTIANPSWMIGAFAGLLLLAVALFDVRMLSDADTYWHLTAGEWMLNHGQVPHTDPFSFTMAGQPWHAHEWLSEVVMALAFRLGSWSGLVALYGLALAAAAMLLAGRLARSLSGLSLALTLTLPLACAAPNLLARPHVLILPVVIAWTAALLRAREAGRAPPLWAAGLMLLWANLHGSFVFGFLLLGAFGLEALSEAPAGRRWRVVHDWGLFAALAVGAAAVTPQGVSGLIFPFKLMAMSSLTGINEWRPTDFSKIGPFEISLGAALFVCLSRGVKVPPIRLLLLLGLLHMALQHNRHVMIAALVAAMVLAPPLREALGQSQPPAKPVQPRAWLAFAAIALALIAGRAALPLTRADSASTPGAALDHVPAALRAQPVFNEYAFGGYLIFRGVKPFIDGRTDLYGDGFVNSYQQIAAADPAAFDAMLKRYNIAWTILPPTQANVALLDARPGWRRIYADKYAVIHARTSTTP